MESKGILCSVYSINWEQNSAANLELVKAFKNAYSSAKFMGSVRVLAAVVSILAATIMVLFLPKWANMLLAVGLIFTFFCEGPLELLETSKKTEAARIQEQFDVNLFRLRWNRVLVGEPVRAETIVSEAGEFNGKQAIKDWYFDTGATPYPLDVLLCQRESLSWDSQQRRHFSNLVGVSTLGLLAAGIGLGLWLHQSLWDYISSVLTPSIPAFLQGYNAYHAHAENASQKEELIGTIQRIWNDGIKDPSSVKVEDCRAVQDIIYILRKDGPMTPDFWHNRHRDRYERDMSATLTRYRQEAEHRLKTHPNQDVKD